MLPTKWPHMVLTYLHFRILGHCHWPLGIFEKTMKRRTSWRPCQAFSDHALPFSQCRWSGAELPVGGRHEDRTQMAPGLTPLRWLDGLGWPTGWKSCFFIKIPMFAGGIHGEITCFFIPSYICKSQILLGLNAKVAGWITFKIPTDCWFGLCFFPEICWVSHHSFHIFY